jgi:hypothetical protein
MGASNKEHTMSNPAASTLSTTGAVVRAAEIAALVTELPAFHAAVLAIAAAGGDCRELGWTARGLNEACRHLRALGLLQLDSFRPTHRGLQIVNAMEPVATMARRAHG